MPPGIFKIPVYSHLKTVFMGRCVAKRLSEFPKILLLGRLVRALRFKQAFSLIMNIGWAKKQTEGKLVNQTIHGSDLAALRRLKFHSRISLGPAGSMVI